MNDNPTLARVLASLRRIESALARTSLREHFMANTLDHIKASVAANLTVTQSVLTLVSGLAQQIRDNAEDPAALEALAGQLDAENAQLAQAVTDNTPTPPAPPAG